jgi:hypothetical protein
MFAFFMVGAAFPEETTYKTPEGKTLRWSNDLPEAVHSITTIDKLYEVIHKAGDKAYASDVESYVKGNACIVKMRITDPEFYQQEFIKGGIFVLTYPEFYCKYLKTWFLSDFEQLPQATRHDFANFDFYFCFVFVKGADSIQIDSKLVFGDYGTELVIQQPFWVDVGKYHNQKLFGVRGIEQSAFGSYITLGDPYNSVTKDYYPSYLVYRFFNENGAIVGIPEIP